MKLGKNDKLLKFFLDLSKSKQKEFLIKIIEKKPELQKTILNKIKTKGIPVSAFNSKLSGLEVICWFLKYEKKFTAKKISEILNRSENTINSTLRKARKKFKGKLDLSSGIIIPLYIFSDRKFAILESLVAYLINTYEMKISQISELIGKKPATIKTVWYRWQNKH